MASLKQTLAAVVTAVALSGSAYAQDTNPSSTPAFTQDEQDILNLLHAFENCSDDLILNDPFVEDDVIMDTCLQKLGTDEATVDQKLEGMLNKYGFGPILDALDPS